MDAHMAEICERECAVAVLAGAHVCPSYGLPCWLCIVLHIVTGTLRSVTDGQFDRFTGMSFVMWDFERRVYEQPTHICPHHPRARQWENASAATLYWETTEASLTSTPVTPAKEGEQWHISSEASFVSRSRGTARSAATGAPTAPGGGY